MTQAQLKEILDYNPDTGVFTWLISRGPRPAGSVAGVVKRSGYVTIGVHGKTYLAHRLAWLYVHGEFPVDQIDHVNREKADNRIKNLRPSTQSENLQNMSKPCTNTSGIVGVIWCKQTSKWRAQIQLNRRMIHIGRFETIEEAAAARAAAKAKYHTFNPEDNNEKTT